MRRALIASIAGWVACATGVMAQAPIPGYRPPMDPYARPMPAPYGQYAPHYGVRPVYMDGAPVADDKRIPPPAGVGAGALPPPAGGPIPMGVPMGVVPPGGAPAPMAPMGDPAGMAPGGPMGGAPMHGNPMLPGPHPMMYGYDGQPMGYGGCGPQGCWDGGYGQCGWNRCPCGPCGPDGRTWLSAELLLWWPKGQFLPPLVTRGVDVANPGILGQAGTVILYGNQRVGEYIRPGVRARFGCWLDECQMLGIEGSFFWIGNRVEQFRSECQVGDFIARPFFNIDPAVNAQDAELVCAPGILCGDVVVDTFSSFYGADANIRRNLMCMPNGRMDLVGGFKWMHITDEVRITENLTNLDAAAGVVGEGFIVRDSFRSQNNFYGGQFGVAGELRSGNFFFDYRALCALGTTHRVVVIDGSTTFLDPVPGGNPVVQPGGLLAQQSNIGTYESNIFSVAPELGLNVGVQVGPGLRLWAGYSFIYWNNVARAGEQIDLVVDARQLPDRAGPGPLGTRPAFNFVNNDFWVHGLNLGLQLRY